MPAGKDRESSHFDESDLESLADGSNLPGKPGRKKNPNSQAARRDQNRIAQREFRLRKQQRIRDLEARVEILSGGKDEVVGEMRNILKDLMQENQTLRSLVRGLGSFIGEGVGGMLPKLGWDLTDFNAFVNKSETDTAWEGYQRRKKVQSNMPAVSGPLNTQGQKRSVEDDNLASHSKKLKGPAELDKDSERDAYSLLMPGIPPPPPPPPPPAKSTIYPSSTRSHDGVFAELMRTTTGSPIFQSTSSNTASSNHYSTSSPRHTTYRSSYMPSMNVNIEGQLPLPFPSNNTQSPNNTQGVTQQRRPPTNSLPSDQGVMDDDDPNTDEAMKLIQYHVSNFKRNNAYCLPPSLRLTLTQRTMPHDGVIDGIIHPELRDRIIHQRDRVDLASCLMDYRASVTIHGDDVLSHSNWEIGEKWLRRYGSLIDQSTLNIANRWRRERGESELRLDDLVPPDSTPGPA